ncbi:MAG TPA: hypothetical protein VIZ22_11220 [Candidatus Limnocylindrales bacterium]
MSLPTRVTREKWTGRRTAGAADDMAWERHVESVHSQLARFAIHRPRVAATGAEWDRHVKATKARIAVARRRR